MFSAGAPNYAEIALQIQARQRAFVTIYKIHNVYDVATKHRR